MPIPLHQMHAQHQLGIYMFRSASTPHMYTSRTLLTTAIPYPLQNIHPCPPLPLSPHQMHAQHLHVKVSKLPHIPHTYVYTCSCSLKQYHAPSVKHASMPSLSPSPLTICMLNTTGNLHVYPPPPPSPYACSTPLGTYTFR